MYTLVSHLNIRQQLDPTFLFAKKTQMYVKQERHTETGSLDHGCDASRNILAKHFSISHYVKTI